MQRSTLTTSSFGAGEFAPSLLLCPANLEARVRDLPIAAAVLPRLQGLLLSDDVDLSEVVALIRLDPGLATRVIHAAGSAYYGRGRTVSSLDAALALIGFREAYRIVATFAMSRFLNTPLRIYGLGPSEFWRRSLACALIMEYQAPARNLDECVAYTAGLLHGLGMIFIDNHLRVKSDPGMQLCERPSSPLVQQEQRLVGMNHAQVAGFVLRKWHFGEEIVEPIERQYNPASAPHFEPMTALLAEARAIAIEIVRSLPPPRAGRADAAPGVDESYGAITDRILALEAWTR